MMDNEYAQDDDLALDKVQGAIVKGVTVDRLLQMCSKVPRGSKVQVIIGEFAHRVVAVHFDPVDGRVFIACGSQVEIPMEVRAWADQVKYIDPYGFVEQGAL